MRWTPPLPYELGEDTGSIYHQPDGDIVRPIVVTDMDNSQWEVAVETLRPFILISEETYSDTSNVLFTVSLAPLLCQFTPEAQEKLLDLQSRSNRRGSRVSSVGVSDKLPGPNFPFEEISLTVRKSTIRSKQTRKTLDQLLEIVRSVSSFCRLTSTTAGVKSPHPDYLPATVPHPESPSVQSKGKYEQVIPANRVPEQLESVKQVYTPVLLKNLEEQNQGEDKNGKWRDDSCEKSLRTNIPNHQQRFESGVQELRAVLKELEDVDWESTSDLSTVREIINSRAPEILSQLDECLDLQDKLSSNQSTEYDAELQVVDLSETDTSVKGKNFIWNWTDDRPELPADTITALEEMIDEAHSELDVNSLEHEDVVATFTTGDDNTVADITWKLSE